MIKNSMLFYKHFSVFFASPTNKSVVICRFLCPFSIAEPELTDIYTDKVEGQEVK